MLKIDKKTVTFFEEQGVKSIKVFFYDAWCSGMKIDITCDFEVGDDLEVLDSYIHLLSEWERPYNFDIYVEKKDREKLENARLTRLVVADHTWKEKNRYIFSSDEIQDRCGCGTSFAFEKPIPKIDLEKLKNLRKNFRSHNS